MNDHVGDVDSLVLHVSDYSDVGEIEKFFDSGKNSHDQLLSMISRLLDDILTLKDFMRHWLPVVVL